MQVRNPGNGVDADSRPSPIGLQGEDVWKIPQVI